MIVPPPPDNVQKPGSSPRFKLFSPILAGATLKERLIGCLGALIGICLTGLVCGFIFGDDPQLPLIVAPIGASAVLLFAVPASPLAQPWSIIGGNTISALIGVTVSYFVKDQMVAIGLAVALAILAMSLTRSLHPPWRRRRADSGDRWSGDRARGFLVPVHTGSHQLPDPCGIGHRIPPDGAAPVSAPTGCCTSEHA